MNGRNKTLDKLFDFISTLLYKDMSQPKPKFDTNQYEWDMILSPKAIKKS